MAAIVLAIIVATATGVWAELRFGGRAGIAARRSLICCSLVANTGYLGYPLVAALLGFDRLSEAVVYDVLVSGPALLVGAFSVGAAFGERVGETPRQRVAAFFTRN